MYTCSVYHYQLLTQVSTTSGSLSNDGGITAALVTADDTLQELPIVPRGVSLDHLEQGLVVALQEGFLDLNKVPLSVCVCVNGRIKGWWYVSYELWWVLDCTSERETTTRIRVESSVPAPFMLLYTRSAKYWGRLRTHITVGGVGHEGWGMRAACVCVCDCGHTSLQEVWGMRAACVCGGVCVHSSV